MRVTSALAGSSARCSHHTIVIPAADLDGQEIATNPDGERDHMTGPVVYWETDDLAAKVAEVEAAGGTVVRPVTEVGGGTSLALLTDPAGNQVGFLTQG